MSGQALSMLRIYFEIGLLLLLGAGVFLGVYFGVFYGEFFSFLKRMRFSAGVQLGYFLVVLSFGLPFLLALFPRATLMRPSAQVYSGTLGRTSPVKVLRVVQTTGVEASASEDWVISEKALLVGMVGVGAIAVVLLGLFFFRLGRFHRFLGTLPQIKKMGRVTLLASDHCPVAYSTWTPRRTFVVVPTKLLEKRTDYQLTVAHELQHHRCGDTRALYLMEFIKCIFFWNPGVYVFSNLLAQLQEFACDEVLIGRRKKSSQAYGSCLIRAAESSIRMQPRWVGTASMAAFRDPSQLRRRIQMILNPPSRRPTRAVFFGLSLMLLVLMTTISYAARSSLQDRRLTLQEAQKYALRLTSSEAGVTVPITMNELVLEKLNYLVGTPEGRKWVRETQGRMPRYEKMIQSKLGAAGLPQELIAVPFFESGFKNLPPTPPQKGAGIWEFIAETARRYKLAVPRHAGEVDERLDPEKETDAAVSYFKDLNEKFKDWRLAIKAYNEGEARVQRLIDQYGTSDPWVLERKSSAEGYLSGVMATIILLSSPELRELL